MVRATHRPAVALILAIVTAGVPAGAEPTRPERPTQIEPRAALDPLARSLIDGEHCAGLVVALISPGAPPRTLAWGETVRGNGKAPDARTVFEIGSISKVFTSLLLAEMVLDKQVALDTPVAALLPPGATLPASKRAITLLDLSTHTSGLPRMPEAAHPANPDNPYADYTTDQLFAFLAAATLAHEPGAGFQYSNLGVALLGHGLARRARIAWPALVTARITQPLGMTSTMVALTDDARARFAQGYNADGVAMPPTDLPAFEAAGALRSTAGDLVVLLEAELAASRDPRSRLARAMALTQQPARELDTGKPGKIGLAWLIKPDGTIWHSGQTGGYHGYVAFDPARRLGVVVLANGMTNQIDALGEAALAALAGAPVPAKLDLPPPDVKVPEQTLDTYVGTYTIAPGFVLAIERRGASLFAQATGQPRLRLHATSQQDFAVRATAVNGTFERDASGKVTGLVVHQHGLALHATRN